MAELEDKLNELLKNPDALREAMALASALGGEKSESSSDNSDNKNSNDCGKQGREPDIDPELMRKIMMLFREFSKDDKDKTALLYGIKPYLSKKRQSKFNDALTVMKIARILPRIKREGLF